MRLINALPDTGKPTFRPSKTLPFKIRPEKVRRVGDKILTNVEKGHDAPYRCNLNKDGQIHYRHI